MRSSALQSRADVVNVRERWPDSGESGYGECADMSIPGQDDLVDEGPPSEPEQKPLRGYRAIHGLGVLSLVLGVLSVLSVLAWIWGLIPAAGIAVGWIALRRIRRTPEETTGAGFAKWGVSLSAAFWAIGSGWLTYLSYTQAPPGYQPISFAVLQIPPGSPPEMQVSPEAEKLDGEQVYVRGYMVPGRQQSGIKRFFLSDDNGVCSFCAPKPKITQLIEVILLNDFEAEFTTHLVGVAGKFRVETGKPKKKTEESPVVRANPNEKAGQPAPEKPGGGAIYQLEADYFR